MDAAPGEDVNDLADPDCFNAVVSQSIQHRFRREHGKVVSVRGSGEVAGRAKERSGDDASDAFAISNRAAAATDVVERFEGNNLFVGGDLNDRVGAGVENRLGGSAVLLSQFLEDDGS